MVYRFIRLYFLTGLILLTGIFFVLTIWVFTISIWAGLAMLLIAPVMLIGTGAAIQMELDDD